MSCSMIKPTKWHVPSKDRSAWASAQSDQSIHCPHEETLGPYLHTECTAKTLIRLGGCPGWSESSLGADWSLCWFCHVLAQIITINHLALLCWNILRGCAVSPEPPLLAHTSSQSRRTFRQKASSLLWMAGHAQLKFVMTECSKTQIRLTGLKYDFYKY